MVFGSRFFVEFIKEDQVGFEAGMKLNMGQWLSIPLVLAGVAILIWAFRKKPAPVAPGKKK
jgi:prolipoprotein diacylglyceryltransferase